MLEVVGCEEADGSMVDIWGNNGTSNQEWLVLGQNGRYQFQYVQNNSKCLLLSKDGISVQIGSCGDAGAYWSITSALTTADHRYYNILCFNSRLLTVIGGLAGLNTYGSKAEVHAIAENSFNQQWEFIPVHMGPRGCR